MEEAEAVKVRADSIRAAMRREHENLPPPIAKTVLTELLLAVLVTVISSVLAIHFKRLSYAVPVLLAAYLAFLALSVVMDCKNGKIKETVLFCTSVTKSVLGIHVVMQSTEETEQEAVTLHDFYYRRKSVCPFREGYLYVVYIHDEQPNRVIAWKST